MTFLKQITWLLPKSWPHPLKCCTDINNLPEVLMVFNHIISRLKLISITKLSSTFIYKFSWREHVKVSLVTQSCTKSRAAHRSHGHGLEEHIGYHPQVCFSAKVIIDLDWGHEFPHDWPHFRHGRCYCVLPPQIPCRPPVRMLVLRNETSKGEIGREVQAGIK